MEALKTALRDGCSTVLWSIVQKALEQQRTATEGTANGAASPAPELEDGPRVHLESAALWRQFFSITNEMIVTKAGRLVAVQLQHTRILYYAATSSSPLLVG